MQRKSRVVLPHGFSARTWAFFSHGADAIEPLTSLSRPLLRPHASPTFADAANWPYDVTFGLSYGSEDAEAAKTTVSAFS